MQKNNHPIQQEELMAYLDGELPVGRAVTAAAHLEQCRECQSLAADFRGLSRNLTAWQVPSSEPQLTPEIAAALKDRSRAQGTSGAFSRRSWRNFPGKRWLRLAVMAPAGAVLVLLMVFMLRSGSYKQAAIPMESSRLSESEATKPVLGTGAAGSQSYLTKSGDAVTANGPLIVRTAQLALTTREFDRARAAMEDALKRYHGYLGELNVASPLDAGRTLTATLRVPAVQLESVLAELKKLGRVESESQGGEEVTQQYMDLQARLANARNTEQRLLDLLGRRTGTLADVLAVEVEMGRVRGEIETMEAERKGMANRVDFATLNLTLTEEYKTPLRMMPESTAGRFRNAAVDGYRTMIEGVVGVALFLVSSGPTLFLWTALLFFPVRAVWRRLRRR